MKKIYFVVMVLAAMLTGCATTEGMVTSTAANSHKLAKDGSGVVYGPLIAGFEPSHMKQMCDSIQNRDSRCTHLEDYVPGKVIPAVGFTAGASAVLVLIPKEMNIEQCNSGQSGKCTILKVRAKEGQFGEVLEIASVPGDGKCEFVGFNGAGGTICPGVWDYRKDMNNWDTTNGIMTVK